MEPSKKTMLLEKKGHEQGLLQINLNYKRREQITIQNNGFSKELRFTTETRNFIVNNNNYYCAQ